MSEMAVSADQIIVIGRGKFITQGSVDSLTATAQGTVFVRASDHAQLRSVLAQHEGKVVDGNDEGLTVSDLSAEEIGTIAFDAGIVIYELTPQRASLEDVFMDLTSDAVEYGSSGARHES
jgi:ABC-2 type transport system ATP-binding protein